MSDIVERLRMLTLASKHQCNSPGCDEPQCIAGLAADEIERLRREVVERNRKGIENERLRGLLRDINSRPRHLNAGAWEVRLFQDDYDRIDAALADEVAK